MEWRGSQERNEGAHYKQTKTTRCAMQHGEVVKLGCNGRGCFNISLYGYWCQCYLREGEIKGGGKKRVFLKRQINRIVGKFRSPSISKNKDTRKQRHKETSLLLQSVFRLFCLSLQQDFCALTPVPQNTAGRGGEQGLWDTKRSVLKRFSV